MKPVIFSLLFLLVATFASGQSFKKLQDEASKEAMNGNFLAAIELSDKAITQATKDRKTDSNDLLSLKSENAAYYMLSENVDKGMQLFEPLLNQLSEPGILPKTEMNVRQNYGISLVFLNQHQTALPHLQRVYELSKTNKIKAEDLVSVVGSLAVCYQYQYEFAKSENTFKEALDILKKENLTNTIDNAYMLNSMALLYKDMLLATKAIEKYEEAERIFNKTKDTVNPQFPVFLGEYSGMLAETGQHDKALKLSFRARNIDRQMFTENSSEYAGVLNNIGFIYSDLNRMIETEQFYMESIKIKKNLPYQRIESYLTSVSNLMNFYNRVGRNDDALELAAELEGGLKNKNLVDTLKRAVFANNLAILYLHNQNHQKSIAYFKDALMYYKAVYGPDNEFEAEIYVNMGTLLQIQEKYDDCSFYLNKAADNYLKRPMTGTADDINTLCNLVMILRGANKFDAAEKYVNQALELAEKNKLKDAEILEQLYITKAQISADMDKVKDAMDYFNKYLDLKYQQIETNFSYMTENEKMFFLEEFETNIRNFYTTILDNMDKYPELIKALLDFRLKTKAFLLNNLSKIKQHLYELKDPVLNEKFEQLKLKRETISKLLNFDTNEYPYALAEATALKTEADLLEKEISYKVSVTGTVNATKNTDWKMVQKQLGPTEAAVEVFQSYLIYDKGRGKGTNYTFIVLKSTGNPVAISIDRNINWENEVMGDYRKSIETKKDNPDVYRRLWKSVNDALTGINTVYVSPDGIYNEVNLNTLLNGESGKYLIEEKNLHVLTSLRDIKTIKLAKNIKPENTILVGNPKFDYDITKLSSAKSDLSSAVATRGAFGFVLNELPGTKEEVEVIKQTLEKNGMHAAMFTEINANEHDIKKVKNPDVLHIATHGFFLEDPKEEDLMGYSKMEKQYYMNPMLRSGIFFSGANKTYTLNTGNINSLVDFEDGMLTAYEAMNMNLDETELVVLSACETGLGKIKNGEGVFGLQRAFKLAGAKSTIMSLWPVSDEATKDLMIAFYGAWTKTGNLYSSFKEAQLEVKKKYPQPYYWGAFVLTGK
ncbi:MAG: CHAT domain-containing protein [Bacteroidia bacterium]|nr:CHAT domain-containing protein [Bacteroidia bacterium]